MNDLAKSLTNEINDAVKSYEVPYLKQLQVVIAAELVIREDQRIQDAIIQCRKIADSVGVPLEELALHGKAKGARKTSPPVLARYEHPTDKAITWTGRGKKPRWVQQHLDSGKPLDVLRIGT